MVIRVTLSLDPVDVDLIDRLAALEGSNRSETVRGFLAEMRPMLRQTIETFEAAERQRDNLLAAFSEAELRGLSWASPELEKIQDQMIGSLARLEGGLAALEAKDPRSGNHGGHTPHPPSVVSPE